MRLGVAFLFLFFPFISLGANNFQLVKDGPIHEAFVTQESGNTILEAVPEKPPQPITEEAPRTLSQNAIWIPGYWSWSRDLGNFIWVSGVWRKAPPDHHWIPGRWKNYQFGWIWLKGFWSKIPESEIEYIPQPPPDPINENVPRPPAPESTYFWMPGYWEWQPDSQKYRWLSGRWEMLGQHMQYVPAQYYWRENGYILVPGFWDWDIDRRGVAYADISIPEEERENIVYEPNSVLNHLFIMEKLFPYWPNYSSLFRYHFYYHQDLWISWGPIPPWWQWPSWWCLPVQDAWWLWWWWSHPNYPNPVWITAELADQIVPPNDLVLTLMKNIQPPPTVTANGAIGSKKLIDAIETATGKKNPILSSDPKQVEQVQDLADPHVPEAPYLRPEGKEKLVKGPPKPSSDSAVEKMELPPGRIKLAPRLKEEQQKAMIQADIGEFQTPKQQSQEPALERELPKKKDLDPFSTPKESSERTFLHTPYYIPRRAPAISDIPAPQHTPQGHTPYYRSYRPQEATPPPPQGYEQQYQYPQPSMQTQHLNDLMTKPQPQENPAGPKAHQYPGDESTLPNY